jgi:hypothetical protein
MATKAQRAYSIGRILAYVSSRTCYYSAQNHSTENCFCNQIIMKYSVACGAMHGRG